MGHFCLLAIQSGPSAWHVAVWRRHTRTGLISPVYGSALAHPTQCNDKFIALDDVVRDVAAACSTVSTSGIQTPESQFMPLGWTNLNQYVCTKNI